MHPDLAIVELAYSRLHRASENRHSHQRQLRLWSEFIRTRDGHRCVDCHATTRLAAHHICRKSFLPDAQFLTGNGITLCPGCHREMHAGFNGRPDMTLPMDAQGGEKIDAMERLYYILLTDATERGLTDSRYYFLNEKVLSYFKELQGFKRTIEFPGSPLEQAYMIWRQSPGLVVQALTRANGISFPEGPILPGLTIVFD